MLHISQWLKNAKLFLRGNPVVYPFYILATPWKKRCGFRICMPWHDLVIEGYPRSANSFSVGLVATAFPQLKVVHHTHNIATLKAARVLKVPSIVLLRNPVDAISSSIIRSGDMYYQISFYIRFYQYVERNRENLNIVTFETVTSTPDVFLNIVANLVGIYCEVYEKNKTKMIQDKTIEHLINHEMAKNEPNHYYKSVPIPNDKREQEKQKIKALVEREARFPLVLKLYDNLCEYAS